MAKQMLQISEEDMPDRIAIYSTLEGYRLMYLMNKELNTYFIKLADRKDLLAYKSSIDEKIFFDVYHWKDDIFNHHWVCIKNKLVKQTKMNGNLLFDITSSVDYWDKSYVKADFILEVGSLDFFSGNMQELCLQLEGIPEVLSAQII